MSFQVVWCCCDVLSKAAHAAQRQPSSPAMGRPECLMNTSGKFQEKKLPVNDDRCYYVPAFFFFDGLFYGFKQVLSLCRGFGR